MRYSKLKLARSERIKPGWMPNNTMDLPVVDVLKAPEFQIVREPGDCAYLVTHVESGEQFELPVMNVRHAVVMPRAVAVQPAPSEPTTLAERPSARRAK
jgi:hypothetical protein